MISQFPKILNKNHFYSNFSTLHSASKDHQNKFDYYCNLRIHKNKSMLDLFNNIVINESLKIDYLVDNGPKLVALLYKCMGKTISNTIINNTIGKVFTAGENIQSVEKNIKETQTFPFILNYCSESVEGQEQQELFFDHNAEIFRNIVLVCNKYSKSNHMVSFKVSCLVELELLKTINQGKFKINETFQNVSKGTNQITLQQFYDYLSSQGVVLRETDKKQIQTELLQVESEQTVIDEVTWKYKIQPIYMFKKQFNSNNIIQYFCSLNNQEQQLFEKFIQRLKYIMDPAHQYNVCVMVDSEQSYLQQTIDCMTEQMQENYNKNQIIVMNTIQNYLKSSGPRCQYEIDKAKKFNLPIVFKMVRGAYMIEENKLAQQNNVESPINDGFEATTKMIENNLEKLIKQSKDSHVEMIVASHNELTIEFAQNLLKQHNLPLNQNIMFAQLFGLSDHMSYSLADQGFKIYKYIPFGDTQIMIPYLMRRAQETKAVLKQNSLQTKLLIDELKRRFYLK